MRLGMKMVHALDGGLASALNGAKAVFLVGKTQAGVHLMVALVHERLSHAVQELLGTRMEQVKKSLV